jgi:predicted subunit of tRNA(5-methylaminomethyl-2-thiouridylate) methyltransferase
MPKLITKEPFVRQSISFPRSVLADAKRVVIEEERHGNISRYIQDLVISDLTRREEAKADKGEAA